MAKEIVTQVENRKLKLTNLDKVLYPDCGVTKAELIQYYLQHASIILPYLTHRPLTLIRYPDGVEGERFYSKNKPTWTPDWMPSIAIKDSQGDVKEYLSTNDAAGLVYLANLAALELHPMQVRSEHIEYSDHFIFDLDPAEDDPDFEKVKLTAEQLKTFLESFGYIPYLKTSGGKGLHIYVPIFPQYTQEVMYAAVKGLAQQFVTLLPQHATLHMSKDRREGKILIDIFRNNYAATCAAPYSTRGKPGAPISTPILWSELEQLESPQQYHIRNIDDRLNTMGDVWAGFYDQAAPLHTDTNIAEVSPLLQPYIDKRNFTASPEPTPRTYRSSPALHYGIQLHDATNLHYDLRLESDQVLYSWAIPKGLPEKPGIKRLAIETEPHPMQYLTFEGIIPKDAYGGGIMWSFDTGQLKVLERKEGKWSFELKDGLLRGQYILFKTKDNQWIIERKSPTLIEDFTPFKAPMLAGTATSVIKGLDYFYELKWDGIRAIIEIDHTRMRIWSRNGNDITTQFPEISQIFDHVEAETAIIDAEIVHLETDGRPNFGKIVGRIHVIGEAAIQKAQKNNPATAYLFDLLYLDGADPRTLPQERRRNYLKTIMKPGDTIRYSEAFDDGDALLAAARTHDLEGIMCKRKSAPYLNGQRSDHWIKVKVRNEDVVYAIGYTAGQGDRAELIGAIHLAHKVDENTWRYMGKVGTGFDHQKLLELTSILSQLGTIPKPTKETIEEPQRTKLIIPKYVIQIQYASLSNNGTCREPVFQGIVEAVDAEM